MVKQPFLMKNFNKIYDHDTFKFSYYMISYAIDIIQVIL